MYVKKYVYYLALRNGSDPSLILFSFTFPSYLTAYTGDKPASVAQSGISHHKDNIWDIVGEGLE